VRKRTLFFVLLVGAMCRPEQALAEVKLHGLFTEGMVLQQGTKVPVWGTAADDEKVTVKIQDQEVSTTAKNGKWRVNLKNLKPGGPYEMTVQGTNTIQFKDVLVGEVWVCSGQSNMEWPLSASRNPKEAIEKSANANIRLFFTPKPKSTNIITTPQTELVPWKAPTKWRACGPETVPNFSAVGYFFGRDLQKARNVPVGLIQSAWGGTPAEAWTSKEVLETTAGLKGLKGSGLYNGMIAPLMPFAIKGVIWYQGESNAGQAYQYRTLFPAMIKNWRDDWKQGDFAFLFVQLAPWDVPKQPTWPELREAQLLTAQKVRNTAMAVITDVGDPKDIHPKDKDPVGARLALCAQAIAYGEKITYSGPAYSGMKIKKSKAILSFKHVGKGLISKGGPLTGFTIAGADKKFVKADAVIEDDKVIVSSPMVETPVAVRFGWANYPLVNLWNRDGLPATPFRTDDFPLITGPKQGAGAGAR
jgi:sialate O-acetylesterase